MKSIQVHCGQCGQVFNFRHPSVNDVADLLYVTLTCPGCKVTLKMPADEVHMISIGDYMLRSMAARGVKLGSLDPAPDPQDQPL